MTFHKKQFIIIYVNIVKRSVYMIILNFIRGIFMAMADSVPGVSGVLSHLYSVFMMNLFHH